MAVKTAIAVPDDRFERASERIRDLGTNTGSVEAASASPRSTSLGDEFRQHHPRPPESVSGDSCVSLPPDNVRALYGRAESYLVRFREATKAAEKAEVLLPRHAGWLMDEAQIEFTEAPG
jgi:hypothetical protein